jgi:hypothetical protein
MIVALAALQLAVLTALTLFTATTWSVLIAQVKRTMLADDRRDGGPFLVIGHGGLERTFPFTSNEVSVGFGKDNDIVVSGPGVSRRHAVLTRNRGKCYVTNLSEAASTFLAPGTPVVGKVRMGGADQVLLGSIDDDAVRISFHRR